MINYRASRLLTAFLVATLPALLVAQSENLVNNPSFEDFDKCPQDYTPQDRSHKLIPGWGYPTIATPDYFNRCSPGRADGVSVPKNFAGESDPRTGDGYVGAILSGTDDGYREYLQGSLSEPLVRGKKYCITYYYKLASYSKFAVDQLSFYFSDIEVKNSLMVNLPYKPQINNVQGLFLDNIEAWEEICTIYTAEGGEQFFIIGNFKSYDNTNYVATDKNMKNLRNKEYAYYFFDDISVRPLDNCTDCNCVQHDFEAQVIDSGYTGGLNTFTGKIDKTPNDGHIKIGMAGGTPPYRVEWKDGRQGAELWNLQAGVYEYTALDDNNCQSSGVITFTKPVVVVDEFEKGLEAIEEGESIVLKNIFFEFNKTDLLPKSYAELDKVFAFMQEYEIDLIEISGHTDNTGSASYNQKLSEGRAKSVVSYLQEKGIDGHRMKAVGYGFKKPIDTNFSEQGQARNRRVEFTLLKK
jgi:outer membrane protein OmpA-like peptidoglycan-associated protein